MVISRQAAILDFCFHLISQEACEQSISNLVGCSIQVRYRSSSILRQIQNPIWLSGNHLGFSFPLNVLRRFSAINLKFGRQLYQSKVQVKFGLQADRKYNMADRGPFWIFHFHSISREPFEQSILNLVGSCIKVKYRSCSTFGSIENPTWLPTSHVGFMFPLNI